MGGGRSGNTGSGGSPNGSGSRIIGGSSASTQSSSSVIPALTSPASRLNTASVLIGGDVMLDRTVRLIAERSGYDSLFATITPLLRNEDIVVANLEGPITSNSSLTLLPSGHTTPTLTFTADPAAAPALKNAGFTLVSLANNHTNDFGSAGLDNTKFYLKQSGVAWFGSPGNAGHNEAVVTVKGIKIAFVGYEQFNNTADSILADIGRLAADGDFVVVEAHWGDEYSATSSVAQRSLARRMVAAGADAIVGSHPHQLEDKVFMGGVPVFYSVGNLLFDQYFSPETMVGNLVELTLSKAADGTAKLNGVKIYTTSTASRTGVTLVGQPYSFH